MCGVSGAVSRDPEPAGEAFVRRALALQVARGPDHQASMTCVANGWSITLGHNRLCVIDLSPGGHQPMWGPGRSSVITYNGEIYNYRELRAELEGLGDRFTSSSDTEVLLAAWRRWGSDALARCNGMFALALLDLDRNELVLARDRFGVKPLHYAAGPSRLRFASTPGPLLEDAGEPDLAWLGRGLALGSWEDDGDGTAWTGLRAVPSGHLVRWSLRGDRLRPEVTRWYDLAGRVATLADGLAGITIPDAAERVRETLESAVALRLRSDVPVGVSLSGGLDSAAVAVAAARRAGRVRGLTFGHPDDPATEGGAVAALVTGSPIDADYVAPPPETMAATFWACLRAQQAPFSSPSVVAQYAIFARARALGLTVMLGGQGGDEAFMGYRKFHLFRVQEALAAARPAEALAAAVGFGRVLWHERGQAGRYWSRGRQYATGARPGSLLQLGDAPLPSIGLGAAGGSRDRQVLDILRFSLPTLLRYEDRNSMGNSIESRLPFLDYRLMELGVALPLSLKLRGGHGKWILRQAVAGQVPPALAWSRVKRGFDVEAGAWMRAGLGDAIREAVHQSLPALGGLVAPGLRIDEYFADGRLAADRAAFADAVALLWLGGWAQARES